MNSQIENAKIEFLKTKQALVHALDNTPEERWNWSPSPTARTPLELVAHSAQAIGLLTDMLNGSPYAPPTLAEADRDFREFEKGFTRREEAVCLLDAKSDAFVAWLDGLAPEKLGTLVTMPFGMDPMPIEVVITFPAFHTRSHIPQIEYIQTIYGDRDWHI
jgi:hypothetical protein